MNREPNVMSTGLTEGMRVEVATHFTGRWVGGFEVAALHARGCQVRRLTDGRVLPIDFDYVEVRPASANRKVGNHGYTS